MVQEVLTGPERRRVWTETQKLGILREVACDGASVAEVARRHDINRGLIYQWRRRFARYAAASEPGHTFVPVSVADTDAAECPAKDDRIILRLRGERELVLPPDVSAATMQRLIRAVEAA